MNGKRTGFLLIALAALLWVLSANCAEADSAERANERTRQWQMERHRPMNVLKGTVPKDASD
ncbi:secreted protein, partial [Candidatus Magnetobacterium bavaricum]